MNMLNTFLEIYMSGKNTEFNCGTELMLLTVQIPYGTVRYGINSVDGSEFGERYGIRYGTVRYGINSANSTDFG